MNPQQIQPDDNTIESEHHTLFIEESPMTFKPLTEGGQTVANLYEAEGGFTTAKLFMGDFAEEQNGTQKIINKLQNVSNKDIVLELHISSYGGSVDELLEYYHLINTGYRGNCVTYLSMGYSAGAIAFLFGTERIIYEHSDFMLHSYSGGAVGKRDDMLVQLAHTDSRIQKFFEDMLSPYFSKKERKKMSKGKDFWLNSEQMLERGIATHIVMNGELLSAQEYLENKYPERRIEREAQEAEALKQLEKLEKKAKKAEKAKKAKK